MQQWYNKRFCLHCLPDLRGTLLWNHSTFMVASLTGMRRHSKCARWASLMLTCLSEVVNTGAWVVVSSTTSERWKRDLSSKYWICSRPVSFWVPVRIWDEPKRQHFYLMVKLIQGFTGKSILNNFLFKHNIIQMCI